REISKAYFLIPPYTSPAIGFIMNTHPPQIPLGPLSVGGQPCMWLIHQFGSLLNLRICKEYSYMARTKTPRNGDARNKTIASTSQIALVPEVKKNSSSV